MKVLKALAIAVGLVGLAVAGWFLFRSWLDMRTLVAAANANRSTNFEANPIGKVSLSFGLGILGGLLIGIGVGLPFRTERSVRKQTLESATDDLHEDAKREPETQSES